MTLRRQIAKRFHPTRRIGRNRAQQFPQLMGGASIEATIGAARQPCDFTERLLDLRIVPFLEHEGRNAAQSKFARSGAEIVHRLFHSIAHVNEGLYLGLLGLVARMAQHLADLGVTAAAVDDFHQGGKRRGFRHPARRPAFAKAAEIDQLHIKPADRLGLQEHLALKLASCVPGGLPAHRGIEGENQAAALACRRGIVRRLRHGFATPFCDPFLATLSWPAVDVGALAAGLYKLAVATVRRNGGGGRGGGSRLTIKSPRLRTGRYLVVGWEKRSVPTRATPPVGAARRSAPLPPFRPCRISSAG